MGRPADRGGGDWRVHDNGMHPHLCISAVTYRAKCVLVLILDPVGAETGWVSVVPDDRLAVLATATFLTGGSKSA